MLIISGYLKMRKESNFKIIDRTKKLAAFTLAELMVVLVIIGILVLLAVPTFMPLIADTRATEAKLQLTHLHTLETRYHQMYARYSDDLQTLRFEQVKLVGDGGTAHYRIEVIEAGPGSFIARATSETDFDNDGVNNVWEIDQDKKLVEITQD